MIAIVTLLDENGDAIGPAKTVEVIRGRRRGDIDRLIVPPIDLGVAPRDAKAKAALVVRSGIALRIPVSFSWPVHKGDTLTLNLDTIPDVSAVPA